MSLNQDELFAALDSSDAPIIESYREHQARKRGLPDDGPLKDLARTYLEDQHRLWPQLVHSGILPPISEPALDRMVDEFKGAFLTGSVATPKANAGTRKSAGETALQAGNRVPTTPNSPSGTVQDAGSREN